MRRILVYAILGLVILSLIGCGKPTVESSSGTSSTPPPKNNIPVRNIILDGLLTAQDINEDEIISRIDLANGATLKRVTINDMTGSIKAKDSTFTDIAINKITGTININNCTLTNFVITNHAGTLDLVGCTYSNVKINGISYTN